ncbi:hypothetical protein SAMN05880582_102108 [Rhizobium sp. RU20A]|uniref:hypothetical protein n=1 Tax=Rhizobium sp. RU20A TaxID=1907412 RepID=UPI000957267B|nr:hypothetical protein [Rhizobium sp. RU20A]SIQ55047.1 hypothetical protein SAMN05880582_102108 [Rhizobium sp. RU20A]
MIKIILVGVWVCAVTLGTVYFSVQYASAPTTPDDGKPQVAAEHVPGELVTIPMIADGAIKGYFINRLSFNADKEKLKEIKTPLKETLTSTLFDILVGSKMIDIPNTRNFELATFKAAIKDGLNKEFGDEVILEVYVEQLEYLSKEDVTRLSTKQDDKKQQKPVTVVDKNGDTAHDAPPAKEASSGH